VEQVDAEKLIGELELAVDRLRSLYEQYFVGIEKLEPQVPRKDVDRRIHVLRKVQLRNTALRFRFQMVLQRYNTYQTHWQRICREIENGTYRRHLQRAQRRFGSTRPPRPGSIRPPSFRPAPGAALPSDLANQLAELDKDFAPPSFDVPVDVDDGPPTERRPQPVPARPAPPRPPPPAPVLAAPKPLGTPGQPAAPGQPSAAPGQPSAAPRAPGVPPPRPQAAPRPPGVPPPLQASGAPKPPPVPPPRPPLPSAPKVPAPAADLSDARMRQIYSEYVDARRRRNESTETLTYQSVAKSLRESGDKLREKHGKPVDFEVAVKDGKTVLRPVLK
jgi:hypothetical protein